MKHYTTIFLVILLLILNGCSNTRFLEDDQVLYTGQEKVNIIQSQKDVKLSSVKPYIQWASAQKPNNSIFDRRILPPIGLWVYNYWEVDEEKKFGNWLYNTLSKPPVLISDINPEIRAQKMENDLFDQGYFQAKTWSVVDTSSRNPKKARVSYFVEIAPPYLYHQIEFDSIHDSIDAVINQDEFRNQIKTGDQFNLEKITSARTGLSRQIQNQGFYYFNPDFIEFKADTALGNNHLNLMVRSKKELPQPVRSRYRIDDIVVHISTSSDTAISISDSSMVEGITIFSSDNYIKPGVIRDAVFFKTGDLYSFSMYQKTISRLNNLGVFRNVGISYESSGADSLQNLLDVRIDLIMADNINLDLAADLVMKSTGFLGPAVSAEISHGNTFKGAEKIHIAVKGGIEWQWGPKQESQLGSFSYDFGVNFGLTYPKIILPGNKTKIKEIMKQETSIVQNFDIMTRADYYSMFSALTNYKYSWGKTREILHSYSPAYFNSVSLLETTPAFDSVVDDNIYIRKSFEEQFIVGMKYDFSYDNTYKSQPQNIFFQAGVSVAGNLVDLFAGIGKDESDRPYEILNNIYSQHVKLITDFRYYINGYNKTLALRLYAGVGLPYRNSTILPYVEQFFSGGAYSIRGFTARTLGPGSYYETDNTYIDQAGDVKLEGNLEYRFGISKILKGAVFLEAGNIWLVNEDENRPGSKFDFSTFYNQLAVGTGVGLRFDFNFFVLRTDLGFPLRTAYVLDDKNWLFGNGSILSSGLFYIAIGYPF